MKKKQSREEIFGRLYIFGLWIMNLYFGIKILKGEEL